MKPKQKPQEPRDIYDQENQEWLASLDYLIQHENPDRVRELLGILQARAQKFGIEQSSPAWTAYTNTITADREVPYPGNREIERRIKSLPGLGTLAGSFS